MTDIISAAVLADLAPTGKLRVGINYGNLVLATRDPNSGDLRGVAVDLARELGKRVNVPVELVASTRRERCSTPLKPALGTPRS